MIVLIWLVVIITTLTLYFKRLYSWFDQFGVKHFKPVPLLGNLGRELMRKKHMAEYLYELYMKYPDERFLGRYEFLKKIIIIRDLDLIKKITVKDFEHFLDHRMLVNDDLDPLFARNLFSLTGLEWKDMRSTLSPAFTSSKMRQMVPFMMDVSNQMIKSLKKQIEESGAKYIDIDGKDLTTRYANDVIASCAFGLKVDSHTYRDNEFYTVGRETANFGFKRILVIFGYASFPNLLKMLNIKLLSDKTVNFFSGIILGTMKDRQRNNIVRPDMIHLLMEAKKGKLVYDEKAVGSNTGFATVEESEVGKASIKRDWSDIDLIAQAVLFFLAGFETVSTAMFFLIYELAVNPDIQERLVQEIKDHDAKNGNKFDFDSIQSMPYLDMVVSEVLRLWPPVIGLDRVCVKDYNIGRPNSEAKKDYIIRKGDSVILLTWAIHHDPDYFPDPFKFDPERFSEQNKHTIKPFCYMPFGLGPRNCIGSRFALCEVKVMAYQLLQQFEISACESTPIPGDLAKDTFNLKLHGGHHLRFRIRK